ncbi:hypothetical protein DPEC_G00063180 [Dallia pectoralis]|uniref:Uncharacterized protein n=1 Tax=Dallia pectoralis TaxID=75939 RepID=A0ACC2H7E5_DALPE|nr:hypothetical protein DPEC_G00063180 [Dallia pectoralis]
MGRLGPTTTLVETKDDDPRGYVKSLTTGRLREVSGFPTPVPACKPSESTPGKSSGGDTPDGFPPPVPTLTPQLQTCTFDL